MYCFKCGKEISESSKFCCYCGAKQPETQNKINQDNSAKTSSDIIGFFDKESNISKDACTDSSQIKKENDSQQSSVSKKTNSQSKVPAQQVKVATATNNSAPLVQQPIKKSHGCLIAFLVIIAILGALIFGVVKVVEYKQTQNSYNSEGNKDGNTKLFSRSANNNDIIVDSNLDLSSLGEKITITPQYDISSLTITITYYDKDKTALTSTSKYLGNVTKGNPVNITVSLMDLDIKVAWNTRYSSISVTGGTVSYFA